MSDINTLAIKARHIERRGGNLNPFAMLSAIALFLLISQASAVARQPSVCVDSPFALEDNIALRVENGNYTHPLSIIAAALMVNNSGIGEGWAYFDDFGHMHLQLSAKATAQTRKYYQTISGFNEPDKVSNVFGDRSKPFPKWISLKSCTSS